MQTTAFCSIRPTTWELTSYTRFIKATCFQSSVCFGPIFDTNAQPSKPRWMAMKKAKIISCHAGWRKQVYLRRVSSSQNVDVRRIKDALDVALERKLDYHAKDFVNVVKSVTEHKVVSCCSQTPKLHCSFLFSFLYLLSRSGFVIIAPRISFIDYLLKTFSFTKKKGQDLKKTS